jgi:hypothetical protein
LLLKDRFYKRKPKPIKLFNKKKSKIINLNKKFFRNSFKISYHNVYLENFNFYKLKRIFRSDSFLSNTFFHFKKFFFMKKFFTFNKKSLNINNLSSNLFFLNFYNFKNKSFSLFFNFFSYFFLFNTPYLFNNNFSYLYMYYLNNSKFLIKNIFSNFSFIYPLNNSHKSSNNLFFKNSNRFFFKNFLFNLKKKSFPKKLNFLKFVISFKFKNILLNNFFNLNTINSNLHPFFMLTFSTFHYKNIFIKKMKTRNLEIFKLNKSDWVSINLARLTRSSFKLDDSDIFYFNSIYKSLQNFNLIPIINSFNHNDLLLENNFFFINLMDYSSNFFFNNLYF